jgi:MFS family permease
MKKNDETKLHAEHKQFNLWTNFKSVLTSKQTWMIGIYSFATWAPIACFAGLWGVPFLRTTYHLSNIAAANKITILWLAIALACPFIGWFSQKIKKRVLLLIIVSITGVFSSIGLIYCTHQSDLFLSLELIGIGIAASGQSLAFVVINDYQPPHLTGVANGFNNMMIVIGGAIFQPLVGWMLDQHHAIIATQHIYSVENFQFALIVLPALYLLAVFMSSFFIKEPKIQAQQ